MALETIRTVDLPSGRRARWLCKLQQYDFIIEHRKGNRIAHVDAFSRALEESHTAVQQPSRQHIPVTLQKELRRRARQQTKSKFIMVVIYDEQEIRMSYRLKKRSMQHLWQSVYESVEDYDESSRYVTAREVLEETGLEIILGDLQYLFNDTEYDCDVYKLKVHPRIELDRIELTKQGEWEHFSWDAYEKMVRDRRTTLMHITYYDQIITPTKPKRLQKVSEIKGAEEPMQILKRPRQKEPVAYTAELCTYRWWPESELVQ